MSSSAFLLQSTLKRPAAALPSGRAATSGCPSAMGTNATVTSVDSLHSHVDAAAVTT
jgi:hypothetical protein